MRFDVRYHGLKRRHLLLVGSQNARLVRPALVSHRRKCLLRIVKIPTHAHPDKLRRNLKVGGHRASACNNEDVLQAVFSVGLEAFAQSIGEAALAARIDEVAAMARIQ
jgi:hypothetical protein